ncbi:hypothetical protein NDU88_007112, partial [Pleurodeles waltl]
MRTAQPFTGHRSSVTPTCLGPLLPLGEDCNLLPPGPLKFRPPHPAQASRKIVLQGVELLNAGSKAKGHLGRVQLRPQHARARLLTHTLMPACAYIFLIDTLLRIQNRSQERKEGAREGLQRWFSPLELFANRQYYATLRLCCHVVSSIINFIMLENKGPF